jgi:hypothetical protein
MVTMTALGDGIGWAPRGIPSEGFVLGPESVMASKRTGSSVGDAARDGRRVG